MFPQYFQEKSLEGFMSWHMATTKICCIETFKQHLWAQLKWNNCLLNLQENISKQSKLVDVLEGKSWNVYFQEESPSSAWGL